VARYIFEQTCPSDEEAGRARFYTMEFPAREFFTGGITHMATAPSYIEDQALSRESGLMENLTDFSFQRLVTPRMLKQLYGVHLLIGFVAAVWYVFSGFQTSTSNGLLALLAGSAAFLLWSVYCRIVVELLAAVFRASQVITNSQG
jgi:hypothetical protein